jgi:hypothetical protein
MTHPSTANSVSSVLMLRVRRKGTYSWKSRRPLVVGCCRLVGVGWCRLVLVTWRRLVGVDWLASVGGCRLNGWSQLRPLLH